VPEPQPRPAPPDLRDAVATTIDALKLTKSDEGLAALARRAADEIEKAADRAAELGELRRDLAGDDGALKRLRALEAAADLTKVVGWLGPQLQGYLRDLGGTPAARAAMGIDKPIGGRLAKLRADAAGQADPAAAGQDDP